MTLELQSSTPATLPIVFKNGLLVSTRDGPVYLLDEKTGKSQLHPFQPPLQPGTSVDWLGAAVTDGWRVGHRWRWSGDAYSNWVFKRNRISSWFPRCRLNPNLNLVAPLAILGNSLFSAARSVGADKIVSFDATELKSAGEWDVAGDVMWGPVRLEDQILVATDANELLCLDEQDVKWKAELPYGPLAGRPMASDGKLVFTSISGMIWQVDGQTGNELVHVDVGEPLGTGPVAFAGNRLLVCGGDGTVHIVNLPSSE